MVDDKIREFARGIASEMLSTEVMKFSLLFMDALAKEKGIEKPRDLLAEIDDLERENDELNMKVNNLEDDISTLEEKNDTLKNEVDELQDEVGFLKDAFKEVENELNRMEFKV